MVNIVEGGESEWIEPTQAGFSSTQCVYVCLVRTKRLLEVVDHCAMAGPFDRCCSQPTFPIRSHPCLRTCTTTVHTLTETHTLTKHTECSAFATYIHSMHKWCVWYRTHSHTYTLILIHEFEHSNAAVSYQFDTKFLIVPETVHVTILTTMPPIVISLQFDLKTGFHWYIGCYQVWAPLSDMFFASCSYIYAKVTDSIH